MFKGEELFSKIREAVLKLYPGLKFVDFAVFGNIHGPKEKEVLAAIPELLHKHGCDAVISAVGA